jgi:DNA-binding GntR family transcriptional regulator
MYSKCENPLIVRALDNLQDLTALAIVSVLWEQWPTWRKEADEHDEILKAAEAGEADEAERLMRTHIERSIARLGEVAVSGDGVFGPVATGPGHTLTG